MANKLGKGRITEKGGTEGRQGTGLGKQIDHNPCVLWLVCYDYVIARYFLATKVYQDKL
ncbi:MAG: hypothetical protein F6J94_25070 [Moorea sp. SIO1F2]|nr:hypothetical protein [Moorena sp. SIO1F2]